MWILRRILWSIWAPAALALIVSFGGVIHPIGDSLAVFRPVLALICAAAFLVLILMGKRWRGAIGLAFCGIAIGSTLAPSVSGSGPGPSLAIYQKNLSFRLEDTSALEADILASAADVVALQEVHPHNRHILAGLRAAYPFQHSCAFQGVGGPAILSKWPQIGPALDCGEDLGLAAFVIDAGGPRLLVASVHLHWPWPFRQPAQVRRLAQVFGSLHLPVAIAGDFNMVHWAQSMKVLESAAGVTLAGAPGATLKLPQLGNLPIAIDHVYMPRGGRAVQTMLRDEFGSDHKGVLATFTLP